MRTADALLAEFERRRRAIADLSASAFQALAILEGADEPLVANVIAERLLVSSASMTSLLDTLERRGLIERHDHPDDRRKVIVEATEDTQRLCERYYGDLAREGRRRLQAFSDVELGTVLEFLTSAADLQREQLARLHPKGRSLRA